MFVEINQPIIDRWSPVIVLLFASTLTRFDRNPYSRSYHSSKRFCHALVLPGHVIYTTCPSYSGLRTRSSSLKNHLVTYTNYEKKISSCIFLVALPEEWKKESRAFYYIPSCIFYRIFVFSFIYKFSKYRQNVFSIHRIPYPRTR